MKRIICLLVALCALMLIGAVAESGFASDTTRINEAAASVVVLEQLDEEGNPIARASGFAAIAPGLVVTSASFIEDAETIVAVTDSGETLSVSGILGCNTDSDVAIIALEDSEKLAPLSIDVDKRILRGSDCVVIGAQGENISVSIGNMSGFFEEDDVSLIQFTAPLSVGSGGSPLFDENGNVAGVTTGFYYDGRGVVQNLNFAVNITEALSLYEIVREDEVASFSEWEITDIGIESFKNPELPMEFYVTNNTDYDISKICLIKSGEYSNESRISGELKKGETATIQITQEEYESKDLWFVRIFMPKSNNNQYDTSTYPVFYLMGKTFEFSTLMNPQYTKYTSYELNRTYVVQRRHMPENADLLSEEKLPYNCIRVINDTDMSMTEFSFSHIGLFRDLVGSISIGNEKLVFLADKDIKKTDTYLLRTFFGIYSYNWNIKPEDILGKTMRFYVGENGEVTFEIQ